MSSFVHGAARREEKSQRFKKKKDSNIVCSSVVFSVTAMPAVGIILPPTLAAHVFLMFAIHCNETAVSDGSYHHRLLDDVEWQVGGNVAWKHRVQAHTSPHLTSSVMFFSSPLIISSTTAHSGAPGSTTTTKNRRVRKCLGKRKKIKNNNENNQTTKTPRRYRIPSFTYPTFSFNRQKEKKHPLSHDYHWVFLTQVPDPLLTTAAVRGCHISKRTGPHARMSTPFIGRAR